MTTRAATAPEALALISVPCAICGTLGRATELYPNTVSAAAFTTDTFSARRNPDQVHYRVVRCDSCGLVRSDPVAPPEVHHRLYQEGGFGSAEETANLTRTYGRYLALLERYGAHKGSLLEVGCATGFLLSEARRQGYAQVTGVEPSRAMVAKAEPDVASNIICDILRPGLVAPASVEVVCMFQVFDHLAEPAAMLDECFRALRPGGMILLLNHNVEALSAKLLGEKSPIIDLQHYYLYSPTTIRRFLQQHGFEMLEVGSVRNDYTLRYLAHLAPLPATLRALVDTTLANTPLGRLQLSLPLGNLYAIARKPGSA